MQAVILAAGVGRRLGDLTKNKPKCMVEICGKPIISYALENLYSAGIRDVVLVVGHEAEKLKNFVTSKFPQLNFRFVHNREYYKTNNIYSLYLARDLMAEEDSLLLESDVLFQKEILNKLVMDTRPAVAVVDRYSPWMDGTVVKVDKGDNITSIVPKEFFDYEEVDEYFKTVNIYKFSKEFFRDTYLPFLEAYIKVMGRNEYYELVLRVISFLDKANIKALRTGGEKWYEIDTLQDIRNAECIFAPTPEEKLERISERYGGYWRFPHIKDFCYLVNPYFPTRRMEEELKHSFRDLISNYPSGLKTQNLLAGLMTDTPEDYIVVGNGASEIISALGRVIKGKPGIMTPTFNEYKERFNDMKVFTPPTGGYSYTWKDLLRASEEVEYLVLINPDNPSGNYINKEDLLKLLNRLRDTGKRLILDESFVDFSEEGEEASFIKRDYLEEFPNLVVIKSISKSYGVPGLRLGVMATADKEILESVRREVAIWNINSFGEFFMQIFPKYRKDYKRACEKIREDRRDLFRELQDIPFLEVIPSEANYFMAEVKGMRAKDLVKDLLWEKDILLKDLSGKEGIKGEFVRIAVRNREDNHYLLSALRELSS